MRRSGSAGIVRAAALTLCWLVAAAVVPGSPSGAAQLPDSLAADCPPVAPTPSFSLAYGPALLDGSGAPVGTVIEALNPRGDTVGCIKVTTAGHFGAMFVYGEDDSLTPPIPGMRPGETVTFHMEGKVATATPEFVWQPDRESHETALAGTLDPTARPCYTLATSASPAAGGSVEAEPPTACPDDRRPGRYAEGSQVEIQAIPAFGHEFSHWSGDIRGNARSITTIMDGDLSLVANFGTVETVSLFLPLMSRGQ